MDRRHSIHRQIAGVTPLSALAIGRSDVRPIAALITAEADDASVAAAARPSIAERP